MKIFKNKQFLQILIVISIVVTSAILFFFPEALDYRYKYSYENVKEGKEQVDSLNDSLTSNEVGIMSSMSKLEELEIDRDRALKDEMEIGFNKSDFVLDVPSILISLEQNAIDNNVELAIDYNSIVSSSERNENVDSENGIIDENGVINDEDNAEDVVNDVPENSKEKEEDSEEQDEITITEKNKEALAHSIPHIEGLEVTVIPISIKGGYSRVRSYIRYLDEVGMIEPSSVKLTSEGKVVTSSVILNVFHREENQ